MFSNNYGTRSLLVLTILLSGGCTLMQKNETTLSVTTVPNVSQCLPLGSVHVVFVEDDRLQVEQEAALLSRAREKAMPLGGDTLVPSGPLREGGQFFNVYRCRDLPRTEPPVMGVELEKQI